MPTRTAFLESLRSSRLLGILRDAPASSLRDLSAVVRESGLRFLEVALNTPDALAQIATLREQLDGFCRIGAGTVLDASQAREAVAAGATFLVSPCFSKTVQSFADEHDIPTLPGAMTPTEVWNAHREGATLVKVFPAKSAGGPGFIKELRGPFKTIPLLACGGVNAENASEYLLAGTDALAFGGSVFAPSRLARGDFDAVRADLTSLREACRGQPSD